MTNRAYYSDLIEDFLAKSADEILGAITRSNQFSMEGTQRDAWVEQIRILHSVLQSYRGRGNIYFEYAVPRLGKRIEEVRLKGTTGFRGGDPDFTNNFGPVIPTNAVLLKAISVVKKRI